MSKDIDIVLGHFLNGVNGHVVFAEQNRLSDPINNAVRHDGEFIRKRRVRLKLAA